jgi:hypothetical protein
MKVLEHNQSRLVIKDGSRWYNRFPLYKLFGGKWQEAIKVVSSLGVITLAIAWKMGKIPQHLDSAARSVFFLLAAPYFLMYVAKEYRGTPTYVFDKSFGQLTVHHDESSKSYALADIVDVVVISRANDAPPPTDWRKIHLILQSGEELELHPRYNERKQEAEMVALIRQFLDLQEV